MVKKKPDKTLINFTFFSQRQNNVHLYQRLTHIVPIYIPNYIHTYLHTYIIHAYKLRPMKLEKMF